jgi:quinoprotein glucose dehydrogenase
MLSMRLPAVAARLVPAALSLILMLIFAPAAGADDDPAAVKPASDEGRRAIAGFRVPAGLKVELFAAEPLVANPVAFAIDEKNRFYVAETFRLHHGVTDTRQHMNWLDDDLASRTVADRVAMYRKFLKPEVFASYGEQEDRIRLVEDRDGDGSAETATVFAAGFRDPSVGLGAGLLARRGTVWYTNIPDLWILRDADGDGQADERESVQTGYGVHVGFLGHDLHGLTWGPDGRLYFTIGDRAMNVTTKDGKAVVQLDSGSVLRCDADGSNLEVFATGLRNPQELAFNELGDLFTCDNNSDGGDRARWVHLVEGGDSGWRIGYQFIERPNSRGPWNAEKLWHPRPANTASYLLPPLANLSDGPSGLTYHPGVAALPDELRGTFFLADFRGSASISGLRTVRLKPRGAGYEVAEQGQHLWGLEATDVDFGTDGALYVSDWVQGWDQSGKGRIYRVADASRPPDPAVERVRTLLAEGMADRPHKELAELLAHDDQRIRREAQFELVERAKNDRRARRGLIPEAFLTAVAYTNPSRLARLHATWGLGQLHREGSSDAARALIALLRDRDEEVRAQAARALADSGRKNESARAPLVELLHDGSPRARFHAAVALSKLGIGTELAPVLTMLRENNEADPYLQHAGVLALASVADPSALGDVARDDSVAVRLAALLAWRRLGSPEVARFLADPEPRLVLEAARAIGDVPIAEALPSLAALQVTGSTSPFVLRRVLAANARLGGEKGAEVLATMAARSDLPTAIRAEAIDALGQWAKPSGRDRIVGLWRPIDPRDAAPAVAALLPRLPGLLADSPGAVRRAASRATARLGIGDVAPLLLALIDDAKAESESRVEALRALRELNDPRLDEAALRAADDGDGSLRTEALRILASSRPAEALKRIGPALKLGSVRDRQDSLAILGAVEDPEADRIVAGLLEDLVANRIEPELRLDVLLAARGREDAAVRDRLAQYESSRPKDDPIAAFREALAGGDRERGRTLFRENAAVYCLRCHKIDGDGGEVGPDLTGIGTKQSREYLLESIVAPNAKISEGFDSLVVALNDGQIVGGIVKGQDGGRLTLVTPEGQLLTIAEEDIEDRKRGPSAMPEDLVTRLSPSDVRDLVEFLAGSR